MTLSRLYLRFLLTACTAGCMTFVACNAKKKTIVYPLVAEYLVTSPDTGALALVNTYYAERFNYTMYDSVRFSSERDALIGKFRMWYDGDNLYARETSGQHCSCAHLTGTALEYWNASYDAPPLELGPEKSQKGGDVLREGFFVRDGDTTWVAVDPAIPNMWFDFPHFPGLPVEFTYNLRGAPVSYSAQRVTTLPSTFDADGYDNDCVRIPALAYAGVSPESELGQSTESIWLYGYLFDDEENMLYGEVAVESDRKGIKTYATMRIENGSFDIELLRGENYTITFSAPNKAKKHLRIECDKVPDSKDGYLFDINVQLFDSESEELQRYLELTPVMIARFDPELLEFVNDKAHLKQVASDIEMMRERESGSRMRERH